MKSLEKIFQVSSLHTLFIVFYLIISIVIITLLFVKKAKWNIILLTSLFIGMLGGIGIYFANINKAVETKEANIWLNMIPSIFMSFSLFFSPILLGTKIIHLFLNNDKNKKVNIKYFINITIVFLVIIIAIPIWNLIVFDRYGMVGPHGSTENIGLMSWLFVGLEDKWYWSLTIFSLITIFSTSLGFTFWFLQNKKDKELLRTRDTFSGVKMLLESCVSYIAKLLPLVIISVLPLMFLSHNVSMKNLKSISIFIGSILLITSVIIGILWAINRKEKLAVENITLLLHTLFFPIVATIITYLNYGKMDVKLIEFITMVFIVATINYYTFYLEIEHSDNFIETSMERSSIIVLGSFSLINNIYLYLLIIKPMYEVLMLLYTYLLKPLYFLFNKKINKGGVVIE